MARGVLWQAVALETELGKDGIHGLLADRLKPFQVALAWRKLSLRLQIQE